jgi:fanconi-associated nuclease 1
LTLVESKDFEQAYDEFNKRIYDFKKIILNPDFNEHDLKLPSYLRSFKCGYIYCKLLSIYANEVLQRLRKYQEANEIFEFLLNKQNTYLLLHKAKWYERLALNYETHLKDPVKSFDALCKGLNDKQWVRKAGRLALYQRLLKMSQTKKYLKISELKNKLKEMCVSEQYEYIEAPTLEIEGTILHSEYIPGRKNIFIQNFENDNLNLNSNGDEGPSQLKISHELASTQTSSAEILIKNRYNISVEHVALTHYIKNLGYTNGKHAETSTITTIYGILFWNILFDDNVENVFVDRFQGAPLDLQTDHFYLNRKALIDSRVDLLLNSPIDIICELIVDSWNTNYGTICSLVNWSLFDDLNDFLSLIRCFTNAQLANLCKYMSQNFRYCRSGGPDLILWSTKENKCKFVEVKGPGDRLSYKQMIWLDFFIQNAIECEVCYVKGQNSKRLRN